MIRGEIRRNQNMKRVLAALPLCALANLALAEPPDFGPVEAEIVNEKGNAVPVISDPTASVPIFISFFMNDGNDFESATYTVPQTHNLRITFASAVCTGVSSSCRALQTAIEMEISFADGEGGTCNSNSGLSCNVRMAILNMNSSDTGANIGTYFPSIMAPVPIEIPAGATISSRLFSDLTGPDAGGGITLRLAGVLVEQ